MAIKKHSSTRAPSARAIPPNKLAGFTGIELDTIGATPQAAAARRGSHPASEPGPVSPGLAKVIGNRLFDAREELSALHELAEAVLCGADIDDEQLAIVTKAITERACVSIDRARIALGDQVAGVLYEDGPIEEATHG